MFQPIHAGTPPMGKEQRRSFIHALDGDRDDLHRPIEIIAHGSVELSEIALWHGRSIPDRVLDLKSIF